MFGIFGCGDCDKLALRVNGLMKQNNTCHDNHKKDIENLRLQLTALTVKVAELEMAKAKPKKGL